MLEVKEVREQKYVRRIQKLLKHMGVNGSYLGFEYVVYAIELAIEDRSHLIYITKNLYPDVARRFHTSSSCVERNIRTVVQSIWDYGERDLLQRVGGRNWNRKPRNAEFIDAMADFVKNLPDDEFIE